jgi:hypothetical protein
MKALRCSYLELAHKLADFLRIRDAPRNITPLNWSSCGVWLLRSWLVPQMLKIILGRISVSVLDIASAHLFQKNASKAMSNKHNWRTFLYWSLAKVT